MVPEFVERNFGLRGALKLHRHAVGRDLVRAPANLALAAPNLMLQAAAGVAEWGEGETRLGLSEPYVARILDLADLVRFVQRTMF